MNRFLELSRRKVVGQIMAVGQHLLQAAFVSTSSSVIQTVFTAQDVLMPAADTNRDYALHANMLEMRQEELVYMIGQHLIWNDIPGDEFLSYSKDTLFLVIHALNRHHKDQQDVTVEFFDKRKAKNVKCQPAKFYDALALYEAIQGAGLERLEVRGHQASPAQIHSRRAFPRHNYSSKWKIQSSHDSEADR